MFLRRLARAYKLHVRDFFLPLLIHYDCPPPPSNNKKLATLMEHCGLFSPPSYSVNNVDDINNNLRKLWNCRSVLIGSISFSLSLSLSFSYHWTAITWLTEMRAKRSVAVMGLAAPGKSNTLDNALHGLYVAGTWVVLPAGNNNSVACDYSPARMQMVRFIIFYGQA